jgi:hypothetical protein
MKHPQRRSRKSARSELFHVSANGHWSVIELEGMLTLAVGRVSEFFLTACREIL